MLVMELLAPEDGWVMFYGLSPDLKQQLHGAVVDALGKVHAIDVGGGARGVHADLRQANVMARLPCKDAAGGGGGGGKDVAGGGGAGGSSDSKPQVRVMFVDFDWSGLQGHTRVPAFSRMRLQGYGCGCEVTQEYDRALWEHERVHEPM
ncbi:hypothetical protein HYH02_015236 [Chlamydomonas schloesseri]|uniref:Protein kinase domain-containing protein n=1 Tax=Chlamydomonas schloesseri TaxID=2026947 RepID=A0A835SP78_9CHLO|nr:hypothetical protein HYH02_015236 [Chlamydomonas schloesseri]|eukprot:KAG2424055.1 hypothetical protein HYH02_015236 [Chlamydomonas schloesseri]